MKACPLDYPSKKEILFSILKPLHALRAEHDSVAEAASQDSLRRFPWILGAAIPALLLGALANWNLVGETMPVAYAGKNIASWLNLSLVGWLLVMALMVRFGRLTHRGSVVVLLVLALSSLLIMAGRSAIDQWGAASLTMFTLGSVFVGALFLIRPMHAIVVYTVSYGFFYYAIGLTQPKLGLLHVNQAQGFGAAACGLLLSILLWRKHTVMTLLQRNLQAANEELKKHQIQLQVLVQQDPLTGLFNRREFAKLANIELMRAQRDRRDTAAIMVDLDFFKRINDTYGHPAGDEVLKFMATALRSCVRSTDMIARLGGEEFIVLLPKTSLEAAMTVAEKIRELVQKSPIHIEARPDIQVTASFGVTGITADQNGSLEALYAAADQALYAAKSNGRNRVEACAVAGTPASIAAA